MQCICLLGYCIFPIDVCALLDLIILKRVPFIFKLILLSISFVWSTNGIYNIFMCSFCTVYFSEC